MDYLIENKILEIPNYIKIDVDGIEHLILKGGRTFLKDKRIKSVQVEMNEIFKDQYEEVMNIMKISNLSLSSTCEKCNVVINLIFKNFSL